LSLKGKGYLPDTKGMNKIVFSLLVLSSFVGCEVEKDRMLDMEDIYQGYRLEFNEGLNTTTLEAMFRTGSEKGSDIVLTSPAYVLVNEQPFSEFDHTKDYPYQFSFQSRLPEARIDFMDLQRKLYTNAIHLKEMEPVGEISVMLDDQTGHLQLTFSGEEQGEDELITVTLSASEDHVNQIKSTPGGNVITIEAKDLIPLVGQEIKVLVTRERFLDLDCVSESGGEILLVYTSKEYVISL
jgi:hypothetical protein